MTTIPTFKCVITGDAETGKSTFVDATLEKPLSLEYIPTIGVRLESVKIHLASAVIRFTIFDTAGKEELSGLKDGYLYGADCVIIMFDLMKPDSLLRAKEILRDVQRICGDIPVCVVGNRLDQVEKLSHFDQKRIYDSFRQQFARLHFNVFCFEISALKKKQIQKPLFYLADRLLKEGK